MSKLSDLENKIISELKSMPEREKIKLVEEQIYNSIETLKLVNEFNKASEDYNFVLKVFPNDKELHLKKQNELYQAKLKMDTSPLVKEYNDLLKTINEPLYYLEFNLINLFQKRGHSTCSE